MVNPNQRTVLTRSARSTYPVATRQHQIEAFSARYCTATPRQINQRESTQLTMRSTTLRAKLTVLKPVDHNLRHWPMAALSQNRQYINKKH